MRLNCLRTERALSSYKIFTGLYRDTSWGEGAGRVARALRCRIFVSWERRYFYPGKSNCSLLAYVHAVAFRWGQRGSGKKENPVSEMPPQLATHPTKCTKGREGGGRRACDLNAKQSRSRNLLRKSPLQFHSHPPITPKETSTRPPIP